MQADIPSNPNPFLTHFFIGPVWAEIGRRAASHVGEVYSGIVAVQSGALKASPRVTSMLGGEVHDRIVFEMTVGLGTPRGGYGAAHNFGIGIHPKSRVPPTSWMPQPPANDLVKALAIVDSMSR